MTGHEQHAPIHWPTQDDVDAAIVRARRLRAEAMRSAVADLGARLRRLGGAKAAADAAPKGVAPTRA